MSTYSIRVVLSDTERQTITTAAKALGLSVSSFLRMAGLQASSSKEGK